MLVSRGLSLFSSRLCYSTCFLFLLPGLPLAMFQNWHFSPFTRGVTGIFVIVVCDFGITGVLLLLVSLGSPSRITRKAGASSTPRVT